ncbi:gamma carbonic anhydrase family protein [Candidatus Laterigemmans baculatus]|uniref:gamma carbonic anhydrase family protein n=1 Tax=Candidatus Laterigemmans baculatus TaxID=2770505 RepID=UPI0013D96452|nr:gamma carbonic anhydrase family protein [Candidatus Laterigemmans baculatus]
MSDSIDPHEHPELIDERAYVAPTAVIRGQVRIHAEASVWFGAVIRGDTERVEIGARTNVQDLAVLHADPGYPCQLGEDVTIGHAAVVHGATIESGVMIGIRAVVLNGAQIGQGSIVGAGAVVTEGAVIPPGSLVVGVPGRVVRPVNESNQARIREGAKHYVAAAARYRDA